MICFNILFNMTFWKFQIYILRVINLRLLTYYVGWVKHLSFWKSMAWKGDKFKMSAEVNNIYHV